MRPDRRGRSKFVKVLPWYYVLKRKQARQQARQQAKAVAIRQEG